MLDLMAKGDASAMKALIKDYAREARAEMGFKHFAWVLGAMGGRFHGATVYAYGPVYGSGAAVVEFHASEEAAALAATRQRRRRRLAQREQAAQGGPRAPADGRHALLRWLRGGFAAHGTDGTRTGGDARRAGAASRAQAIRGSARPRSLPLVPHPGRDRRAI